jgi:hypothetical protein
MSLPVASDGQRAPRRWPLVALLLPSLAWAGLVVGTVVGSSRVPEGSGLAGPAIALAYGVMGMAFSLVLGGLFTWRAPHLLLQLATAVAVVVAVAAAGLVAWRFVAARQERMVAAGLDVPLPPPAGFRIDSRVSEADEMRRYRELSVDADAWSARWVAVGPEAVTCRARLVFAEADALRRKSDEIRAARDHFRTLCGLPEAAGTHVYTFRDSAPGESAWSIAADFQCLQQSAELGELDWILGRIPIDAVSHGRAECGRQ